MMFAKGTSSDIPVSVEHSIRLQLKNHTFPVSMHYISLNLLASAGTHFLKRVRELRLQGLALCEDSCVLFLSTHLQLHSLELINMEWPDRDTLQVHEIISALHEQNTLRNLTISRKVIALRFSSHRKAEYETVEALCKWLSSPGCSLKTLQLDIYESAVESTEDIIYSLTNNCTLEDLYLTQLPMSLEALSILLLLPLVTLNLHGCKLDFRTKELRSSSILAALDICNEGGIALAKILKKNKTLKKLNLSYCSGLSQAVVHTLEESIKDNDREIELNLEHFNPYLLSCLI